MKSLVEKLGSSENRVWGSLALFTSLLLPAMIILWKTMDREEKVRSMMLAVWLGLTVILYCIPFLGWVCDIVLLVFYVICVINFFKGNLDYKIPICAQLAEKFVKK